MTRMSSADSPVVADGGSMLELAAPSAVAMMRSSVVPPLTSRIRIPIRTDADVLKEKSVSVPSQTGFSQQCSEHAPLVVFQCFSRSSQPVGMPEMSGASVAMTP